MGRVPPLHPLIWAPEMTATALKTLARLHASA
jgi:hypothetical protein